MEPVYELLTKRARTLQGAGQHHRVLVALAGPPGSGKSTVAAEVVERLNKDSPAHHYAAVLPMDGFHLSRAKLDAMSNKEEAYARRGAAWTFDADGVVDLVQNLHESRNDQTRIHSAPSFDHATKDPVDGAITIDSRIRFIILEGNWLLYNEHPWCKIAELVDDTWFIDVDPDLALNRVARRHLKSGIETSWSQAIHRTKANDMLNGDLVRAKLVTPAIAVRSVEESV